MHNTARRFDIPGAPAELLAIINARRATIPAGMTMELDTGDAGDTDTGDSGAADQQQNNGGRGPGTDSDKHISEMTDAEKATYFEKKARRYRNALDGRADYDQIKAERDQLKQQTMTDGERAIAEAKAAARAEAEAEFTARTREAEVRAEFRATLPHKTKTEVDDFLDTLNLTKFLNAKGEVDTDKVKQTAGFTPGGWPDLGQGQRHTAKASKAEAGISEAERRFGKKKA